jgi:serine/threonine protein phosphatase PrpC
MGLTYGEAMHIQRDSTVAGGQIVGSRQQQEDNLRIEEIKPEGDLPALLLVLCDGMGGHTGGEVASRLVCDTLVRAFPLNGGTIPERLTTASEQANEEIAAKVQADRSFAGMGTTLIAAVVSAQDLYWLSIGDSPMWLFRDKTLRRLNADHSMKAVLDRRVAAGELSRDAAQRDRTRNHLLSVLCGSPPPMVDCSGEPFPLMPGDQLLLASDGVETLSPARLTELLEKSAEKNARSSLSTLLKSVKEEHHPRQDNASAILLKMGAKPSYTIQHTGILLLKDKVLSLFSGKGDE